MEIKRLNYIAIAAGVIFVTLLTLLTARNLDKKYLWYDESGQFFISKGLNHYSDPFSQEQGLREVIENNSMYNLDPGGFGIILHFWSKVSNHHIWLRLLPFLFFVAMVLMFIYLAYLWLNRLGVAILFGAIPFCITRIMPYAVEIRAYSMEMFGAIFCLYILFKIKDGVTLRQLLFYALSLSILITSRYSSIICVFVLSLHILYVIFRSNNTFKVKLLWLFAYSTPLLITVVGIYLYSMSIQNKSAEQLGYLPYLSSFKQLLFGFDQRYTIMFVIAIVFLCLRKRVPLFSKYSMTLSYVISINVLCAILSILDMHPWGMISRCVAFWLPLITIISIIIVDYALSLKIMQYRRVALFLFVIAICGLSFRRTYKFNHAKHSNESTYVIANSLSQFNRICVDRWDSPAIRYLYEYGVKSKNRDGYPEKFTFLKDRRHGFYEGKSDIVPELYKDLSLSEFDLLIAYK